MRNRTFPKENQKKLNKIISDLKAELRQKDKELVFLRKELNNIMKPARERKPHVEEIDPEEQRRAFVARFKKEVLGGKS